MWSLKFKIFDDNNLIRKLIEKHKITIYYYPTNHYTKNNRYFFTSSGVVKGKNIDSFYRDLRSYKNAKKGRRVELLETNNQFVVLITSHSFSEETKKYVHTFYDPSLIHLKPVIFDSEGEEWEVVSLEKERLQNMIKIGKEIYNLKLLRFYWKKTTNFGFLSIIPELTKNQEDAIELAFKEGYYNYPRDINLYKLAKIAKKSYSTFQAHTRKAENKIISFVLNSKK